MTGVALLTNLKGGVLVDSSSDRWLFQWRDAIDFGPADIGHGTKLEFSPGEHRMGKRYAYSVRLEKQ